ncbi:HAMP domain-containing protein [Bradyrhizobium sp. SRL28]|uniref:methyl-accepting chemotaxis protein n=1 Tax=Bradyrhizobium sp. SRL28 TaxID=2836178 RepID=UPI001BDE2E19|nr:HAMP domain-containing methyl-accepting chemotaxis protein [Bradyrhizobium sp. SRL28]MBT1511225.1 HAMP domain-containing protein [Bradyrhizobium sp. SRL28]
MTLRLTISRAILIFGLVTALGLGAVIATSVYGLSQLKVGGPLYNQIKLGNDLIADILPPPEYVIEAYLEATLVLHDPAQLSAHRDRIVQLKKEYDERRDFWVKSDLDPVIKTKLVEKSDSEVRRFWTAIQDGLLPALAKSDSAAAAKSYAEITARYTAHRAIIDDIVKQTNDQNAATEVAATGRVSTFTLVLWGVSAAVFLVIGAGIFGVAFGVIRPIAEMTAVMKGLAGGDLNVSVPALSRGDEVGAMARAVQVFKDNALRVQSMEQEQAGLKLKAEGDRKAAMQQMADGFDSAIGKIIQTVSTASSELESSAGQLTKTAEVTQVLSATVASASEQSSANAQSAAAAAEEMASSVSEISRQVQDSHKISREAVSQVEQTNARISDLAQSASRIGEVVKMISAVAEQTNLLALNATIEAARAGEAGRGFAVVASEVKALAAQTAKATEEISEQIGQMQSATNQSVSSIQEIGGTIGRIAEISQAIAAAVEEQGAATQEISRNVQQAAQGATQVAGSITDVNRGATDTGAASTHVHGLARSLLGQSNHLKGEVEKFLSTVRAA